MPPPVPAKARPPPAVSLVLFLLPPLLLLVALARPTLAGTNSQELVYFKSDRYSFGTVPLQSITAMGLENNQLICIGSTKANNKIANTTGVSNSQVWSNAANVSATFQWSWGGSADYTAVGVKHRQLQTPENLMFLARATGGIEVLSYWYLSPRETPATQPPRIVSFGNGTAGPSGVISALSSLDAAGGIFAAEQTRLWWIPVVRPLSASPPDSSAAATTMVAQLGGVIQAIWSVESAQTLYVAEWFNSSNNIHAFAMNGRTLVNPKQSPLISINSTIYPNPPADQPVISCVVSHPRTQDVYVGMFGAGGILIYDQTGDMRAQVTTTFINVLSMEIDNDGTNLFIAGDDGAGTAVIDLLNLKALGLADNSIADRKSGGLSSYALNMPLVFALVASVGLLLRS
ncbi:hypothetical protein HDU88_002483 [Geranomyces variabilis]|nr:hypothetical protein HDU88_002483 [Geranomyces variabilis]